MINPKKLIGRIRAKFNENLPRDTASMDRFAEDVLSLYDLPKSPDYKRAVVKAIHGISQSSHKAPKQYFYDHMARFEVMRAAVGTVTEIERQEKAATPKREPPPETTQRSGQEVG